MKLQIVDRRKVLRDFNERNCTTQPAGRYVGVRILNNNTDDARLLFLHRNKSGRAIFIPDEEGCHLRGLRVNDCYHD